VAELSLLARHVSLFADRKFPVPDVGNSSKEILLFNGFGYLVRQL
jgi:hypothetical protein